MLLHHSPLVWIIHRIAQQLIRQAADILPLTPTCEIESEDCLHRDRENIQNL